MFTKKERIGARIILKNANQGRKFIKTDEFMTELKSESGDEFWGDSEAEESLSKFEAGNLIVKIDSNTYRILADIAAIREFVLRESERQPEEEVAAYDLDLEELLGSAWTLTAENQTEDKEEDEVTEERKEYIRARRLELLQRMRMQISDDGYIKTEADEADDEDEDEDEDDGATLEERCSRLIDEFEQILEGGEQDLDQTDAQGVSWREKCNTLIETLRKFVGEEKAEETDETMPEIVPPEDPMYVRALAYVVDAGIASNSFLRVNCRIGFFYAYRILAWMESQGFVSEASDPHEMRKVLLTREEFTKRFGDIK